MQETYRADTIVEENPNGDWVRWSDVEKLREELESQIPEKRIERLERMIGLIQEGKCPECMQMTKGYEPPNGLLAPEAFATLREIGIDPLTGHRFKCSMAKKVNLP